MRKIYLASLTPDHRGFTASAFLQVQGLDATPCHFDHADFSANELTLTTLESLGIINHVVTSQSLNLDMVRKHQVIAFDETTRNKIQVDFGRLVPIYNEVALGQTTSIPENNIIDTIHHFQRTSHLVDKRRDLFD